MLIQKQWFIIYISRIQLWNISFKFYWNFLFCNNKCMKLCSCEKLNYKVFLPISKQYTVFTIEFSLLPCIILFAFGLLDKICWFDYILVNFEYLNTMKSLYNPAYNQNITTGQMISLRLSISTYFIVLNHNLETALSLFEIANNSYMYCS